MDTRSETRPIYHFKLQITQALYQNLQVQARASSQPIFRLTKRSIELFRQGIPGQGYVGCVDFETGEIDLIPANNKDDGRERRDYYYEGKKYNVESPEPLGKNTGTVHTSALALIGKNHKQGVMGGFGIFKGNDDFLLKEFRVSSASSNTITFVYESEYLLVNYIHSCQGHVQRKIPSDISKVILDVLLNELPTQSDSQKRAVSFTDNDTSYYFKCETDYGSMSPDDIKDKLIKNLYSAIKKKDAEYVERIFLHLRNHYLPELSKNDLDLVIEQMKDLWSSNVVLMLSLFPDTYKSQAIKCICPDRLSLHTAMYEAIHTPQHSKKIKKPVINAFISAHKEYIHDVKTLQIMLTVYRIHPQKYSAKILINCMGVFQKEDECKFIDFYTKLDSSLQLKVALAYFNHNPNIESIRYILLITNNIETKYSLVLEVVKKYQTIEDIHFIISTLPVKNRWAIIQKYLDKIHDENDLVRALDCTPSGQILALLSMFKEHIQIQNLKKILRAIPIKKRFEVIMDNIDKIQNSADLFKYLNFLQGKSKEVCENNKLSFVLACLDKIFDGTEFKTLENLLTHFSEENQLILLSAYENHVKQNRVHHTNSRFTSFDCHRLHQIAAQSERCDTVSTLAPLFQGAHSFNHHQTMDMCREFIAIVVRGINHFMKHKKDSPWYHFLSGRDEENRKIAKQLTELNNDSISLMYKTTVVCELFANKKLQNDILSQFRTLFGKNLGMNHLANAMEVLNVRTYQLVC